MRTLVEVPIGSLNLSLECRKELLAKGIVAVWVERDITRTFLCDKCGQHKCIIELYDCKGQKLCEACALTLCEQGENDSNPIIYKEIVQCAPPDTTKIAQPRKKR